MLATSQLLAIGSFLTLLGYLAANDVRSLRLPLSANVAFLATGLIAGGVAFAVPVMDRLIGAGAGFVTLSLVALSYRAIRDHDGLGGGDPIMIAGLGGWLGWQPLPRIVFMAALIGLLLTTLVLALRISKLPISRLRLPFGTFLGFGALIHLCSETVLV